MAGQAPEAKRLSFLMQRRPAGARLFKAPHDACAEGQTLIDPVNSGQSPPVARPIKEPEGPVNEAVSLTGSCRLSLKRCAYADGLVLAAIWQLSRCWKRAREDQHRWPRWSTNGCCQQISGDSGDRRARPGGSCRVLASVLSVLFGSAPLGSARIKSADTDRSSELRVTPCRAFLFENQPSRKLPANSIRPCDVLHLFDY